MKNFSVTLLVDGDLNVTTSRWVENSLFEDLSEKCISVKIINLRCGYKYYKSEVEIKDILLELDKKLENSILFMMIFDHSISSSLKRIISAGKFTSINYIVDPDINWHRSKDIYKISDITCVAFLNSFKYLSKKYKKIHYMPYGIDIPKFDIKGRKKMISFFGSPNGVRLRYLHFFLENAINIESNIKVYNTTVFKSNPVAKQLKINSRWKVPLLKKYIRLTNFIGKFLNQKYEYTRLTDSEYYKSVNSYWISFGISEYSNTDILSWAYCHYRMRDLESLSYGCIHITRSTEDIEHLKSTGVTIFTYKDARDLLNTIKEVNALSSCKMEEISKQNINLLRRQHTWHARLQSLLSEFRIQH